MRQAVVLGEGKKVQGAEIQPSSCDAMVRQRVREKGGPHVGDDVEDVGAFLLTGGND